MYWESNKNKVYEINKWNNENYTPDTYKSNHPAEHELSSDIPPLWSLQERTNKGKDTNHTDHQVTTNHWDLEEEEDELLHMVSDDKEDEDQEQGPRSTYQEPEEH